MQTPLTAKGKPCKLCLESSTGICHLHGEHKSPRSPKRSPKKTTPIEQLLLGRFENLPLPALQEILLKLDRKDLEIVCEKSLQAAKICAQHNFKTMYDARHPDLVIGRFKTVDKSEIPSYYTLEMPDENKNILEIIIRKKDGAVMRVKYTNEKENVYIEIHRLGAKRNYISVLRPGQDIRKILQRLGKEEWVKNCDSVSSCSLSTKAAREVWKFFQERVPELKSLTLKL